MQCVPGVNSNILKGRGSGHKPKNGLEVLKREGGIIQYNAILFAYR